MQDDKYTQSRRRRRIASLTLSEQSDCGSDTSHLHTRDRHDHSQRKTEEFVYVQDLDKITQKLVEEAGVPHYDRLRVVTIGASSSPFFESILGCDFQINSRL